MSRDKMKKLATDEVVPSVDTKDGEKTLTVGQIRNIFAEMNAEGLEFGLCFHEGFDSLMSVYGLWLVGDTIVFTVNSAVPGRFFEHMASIRASEHTPIVAPFIPHWSRKKRTERWAAMTRAKEGVTEFLRNNSQYDHLDALMGVSTGISPRGRFALGNIVSAGQQVWSSRDEHGERTRWTEGVILSIHGDF